MAAFAVLVGVAGCATRLPTIGEAERLPLTSTRALSYDPTTPQGDPVTVTMVASAVTDNYVALSHFQRAETTGSDPAWSSISAQDAARGPMTRSNTKGVRARLTGGQTVVEYVNARQTAEGSGQTVTTVTLVARSNGEGGKFQVNALTLSERIGLTPGLPLSMPTLASKDEIAADVANVLATMKPGVPVRKLERSEVNVGFPVPAVFASFERALGTPAGATQTPADSRSGQFKLKPGDASPSVTVNVVPYRDGSKVLLAFPVEYLMKEGGGHTYQPDKVQALVDRLRRIAAD